MVNAWSEGEESFADDPPNATLSILGGDEIQDVVVVFSDPVLLGSKLTCNVRVLDGKLPTHGGIFPVHRYYWQASDSGVGSRGTPAAQASRD